MLNNVTQDDLIRQIRKCIYVCTGTVWVRTFAGTYCIMLRDFVTAKIPHLVSKMQMYHVTHQILYRYEYIRKKLSFQLTTVLLLFFADERHEAAGANNDLAGLAVGRALCPPSNLRVPRLETPPSGLLPVHIHGILRGTVGRKPEHKHHGQRDGQRAGKQDRLLLGPGPGGPGEDLQQHLPGGRVHGAAAGHRRHVRQHPGQDREEEEGIQRGGGSGRSKTQQPRKSVESRRGRSHRRGRGWTEKGQRSE